MTRSCKDAGSPLLPFSTSSSGKALKALPGASTHSTFTENVRQKQPKLLATTSQELKINQTYLKDF